MRKEIAVLSAAAALSAQLAPSAARAVVTRRTLVPGA
jgi:hypothetical protein